MHCLFKGATILRLFVEEGFSNWGKKKNSTEIIAHEIHEMLQEAIMMQLLCLMQYMLVFSFAGAIMPNHQTIAPCSSRSWNDMVYHSVVTMTTVFHLRAKITFHLVHG